MKTLWRRSKRRAPIATRARTDAEVAMAARTTLELAHAPMWAYYEHAVVAAAAAAVVPMVNDSATPPLIIDEDVDAAEETDKVFEDLGEHSCTASFEEALSVLSQVA